MTIAPHQRRMLVLCLATVYFVWGTSYIATRVGVLHLPPLLFGGVRFLIGGGVLCAIALWRGFRFAQLHGHWRDLAVMSVLGIALCNGLQVWAMQWVPSHTGALLNASSAMWIVVFGLFGRRAHRPPLYGAMGLVIGFAGVALLIWPHGGSAHAGAQLATPLLPQLVILVACIVWSMGTIYMRNHAMELDLFAFMGVQMFLGGVWMTVTGVALGEVSRWHWSWQGAASLLYLVIFSSCIAYTAYAWLARHATPAQTGSYSYANPVIAAVVGYLVLDERMSAVQMLGAAIILAGVLMINWPVRSRAT